MVTIDKPHTVSHSLTEAVGQDIVTESTHNLHIGICPVRALLEVEQAGCKYFREGQTNINVERVQETEDVHYEEAHLTLTLLYLWHV